MYDYERVIQVLLAEEGYREGYSNGQWTNENKYSKELPGFGWSDFQAWCATFQMWGFWKTGQLDTLPAVSAGVWYLYQGGLAQGRFTEYPTKGALGIVGKNVHVFMATGWDDTYVYTIEGNTNTSGAPNGNGVYRRSRIRRDANITGYVIPKFRDGVIISADPKWHHPEPTTPQEDLDMWTSEALFDIINRATIGVFRSDEAKAIIRQEALNALNFNVTRAGFSGEPGPTSVLNVAAWFDANMDGIRQAISAVNAKSDATLAAVAEIANDPDVSLDAIKAAVQQAVVDSVQVTGSLEITNKVAPTPLVDVPES